MVLTREVLMDGVYISWKMDKFCYAFPLSEIIVLFDP